MKYIFFLLFLVVSIEVFPAEVILQTGEAFIVDILVEERNYIKVKWKDKTFTIPKDDILSVDKTKTGKHISYAYYQFIMRDDSKIKGVIAEETNDTLTVNTDMGFIILDKSKIKERIGLADPKQKINFPSKYGEKDILLPETMIGIGGSYYSSHAPLNLTNANVYGGFLFLEPDFFRLSTSMRFGYRMEYHASLGDKAKYDFFNNIAYFQYGWQKKGNPYLDFYVNLGAGIAYERFISYNQNPVGISFSAGGDTRGRSGGETNTAINPLSKIVIGWRGLKYKNFRLRVALENTAIYEPGTIVAYSGGSIALVYVF